MFKEDCHFLQVGEEVLYFIIVILTCTLDWGHRTTDAWNHKPYLYTLSSDFKTSYVGPDIDTGKSAVEDPLSIYEEDGKIYCTICNWFVPGPGCVGLYEVTIE